MPQSFFEIATSMATKQPILVKRLLKAAPILGALPMQESSHGISNVYEEIINIDPAEQVDRDAALPFVDVESELKETQLAKFGARLVVGHDRMRIIQEKTGMSVSQYFGQKADNIAKRTGMDIEYAMIYNLFRNKALVAGNSTNAGGTGSANKYSLVFATFNPGENIGLYDKSVTARKEIMEMIPLHDLKVHNITDKYGKKYLGYEMDMMTYFSVQIANIDGLYAIPNIDLTVSEGEYLKLPTAMMIDDALDAVEADPASTLIMGHPRLMTALGEKYKGDIVRMTTSENGVNNMITSWNTIPMMGSRNFKKGIEDVVDFS